MLNTEPAVYALLGILISCFFTEAVWCVIGYQEQHKQIFWWSLTGVLLTLLAIAGVLWRLV